MAAAVIVVVRVFMRMRGLRVTVIMGASAVVCMDVIFAVSRGGNRGARMSMCSDLARTNIGWRGLTA